MTKYLSRGSWLIGWHQTKNGTFPKTFSILLDCRRQIPKVSYFKMEETNIFSTRYCGRSDAENIPVVKMTREEGM